LDNNWQVVSNCIAAWYRVDIFALFVYDVLQIDTTSINVDAISAALGDSLFSIASAPEEELLLQGSLLVIGPVAACPVSSRSWDRKFDAHLLSNQEPVD
jgi:hypothetical protein